MHELTVTLPRAERVESRELELTRALDEYAAVALFARLAREAGAPVPEPMALARLSWLALECAALDASWRLARNASAPTGRTEILPRREQTERAASDPITRGAGRFLEKPVTHGTVRAPSARDMREAAIAARELRAERHRTERAPLSPAERAMKARAARRRRRK